MAIRAAAPASRPDRPPPPTTAQALGTAQAREPGPRPGAARKAGQHDALGRFQTGPQVTGEQGQRPPGQARPAQARSRKMPARTPRQASPPGRAAARTQRQVASQTGRGQRQQRLSRAAQQCLPPASPAGRPGRASRRADEAGQGEQHERRNLEQDWRIPERRRGRRAGRERSRFGVLVPARSRREEPAASGAPTFRRSPA